MDSGSAYLVSIFVCLVFSAYFSASETALTSLGELKVKHMIQEMGEKGKILELWLLHPNKVLYTLLIGNNIVNILSSVIAADFAYKVFKNSSIALITGIMTILIIFFGEIFPKTYAKHNAEKLSIFTMYILRIFFWLFYPFSWLLNKIVKGLIKFFGGKVEQEGPKITEDELEFLISIGEKEGVLENQKKEMLHNIFEISETSVKEIMVPLNDVTMIEISTSINEIIDTIAKTEYSRIPIYEENKDNVIGILYSKDIIKYINKGLEKLNIKNILKKPYFVPSTKRIDDLLREFQINRIHLALVVDEYGSIDGLITLEDILEEIVGEIRDEYDKEEEEDIKEIGESQYIVKGRLNIDDFCEYFNFEKTENMEQYETISGLLYDLADKIPDVGEEYIYNGYKFIVVEKDGRKIKKIKLIKLQEES
ncbi:MULTISPECIES: hemolysin family protein [Calditerrivibrio]|uniref:HlyC/CorC family transporter n=1 Tax=Calditerrivibrio nitroreducens TaxID=477976 RepID=A0A2J6WHK1_9BACT|nr:MAG: HlyC/CorC family transporter [Calditerrivibrio nitroreducens]